MTEPAATFIEMPLLPDFSHALLENVTVGTRRVVTLTLTPLIWVGTQEQRGLPVTVRLGGLGNFEEAAALFAEQRLPADIAGLRYDAGHISKPGNLYLELVLSGWNHRLSFIVTASVSQNRRLVYE